MKTMNTYKTAHQILCVTISIKKQLQIVGNLYDERNEHFSMYNMTLSDLRVYTVGQAGEIDLKKTKNAKIASKIFPFAKLKAIPFRALAIPLRCS